jgi:hypothetical protein
MGDKFSVLLIIRLKLFNLINPEAKLRGIPRSLASGGGLVKLIIYKVL